MSNVPKYYVPNVGEIPQQGGPINTDSQGLLSSPGILSEINSALILAAINGLNPSRTFVTGSAVTTAGGAGTATLTAVAGKTTYITGFTVVAGAVSAEVEGNVTVTGPIGGTLNYRLVETSSAGGVINVSFSPAIPASAPNTNIVVNVPVIASGSIATLAATGYNQ
jgi:hypothetical protein